MFFQPIFTDTKHAKTASHGILLEMNQQWMKKTNEELLKTQ